MAKPEQVLIIEPQNELRFKGPFTNPVTSYMKLKNPSNRVVLYKIKTTVPKKYCVRPNSGILDPDETHEIAISLQPFLFDPAEKSKHKFMVQAIYEPDGEYTLDEIWKNPEQLMDSKLRCVFDIPPETGDNADVARAQTGTESLAPQQTQILQQPSHADTDDKINASFNTSTKITSSTVTNANIVESELQNVAEEVQQLREENSSLRQENLRLKEEALQLKLSGQRVIMQPNRYAPPMQHSQQNMPAMYVALAVVLAFLGIILGKYIL